MKTTTRRRRALSTVLALFLAIESVSAVAAAAVTAPRSAPGAGNGFPVAAAAGTGEGTRHDGAPALAAAIVVRPLSAGPTPEVPDSPRLGPTRKAEVTPSVAVSRPQPLAAKAITKPAKASSGSGGSSGAKASSASTGKATSSTKSYRGRNHVWIPALHINRSVSWFPCDRERAPDNYVYRWGCAGRNNVYLLGHAWGVFKPLHDAYVGGRLRKGMKAIYADAKGKVHTYTVRWWKLTRPTTAASWAWAGQSVPSMTLQTCVGRNSEYRLMVRLVEVH